MKKFFLIPLFVMLSLLALPAIAQDIEYKLNPTVSPKSMSEVMQGAKVKLDFGDTKVVLTDDAAVTATPFTEEEDGYDTVVTYGDPVSLPLYIDENGCVCINFDVKGTTGTQYELKLARGVIVSEDGTQANMAKTWKYFLSCKMQIKAINPGNSKVETLSNLITINFYSQPLTLADDATAELKNEETGKTYTGIITIPEYQEKVIKIKFDYGEDADENGELCVAGSHTLTIAEDLITDKDGSTNSLITNTWIISGPIDINDIEFLSVLPENEAQLASLSSISITFPETPVLTKKLDATIKVGEYDYDFTLQNNILTTTLSSTDTNDGIYTVVLPAGAVYSLETGHGNKEIELTYYLTTENLSDSLNLKGIESVTIFNCQGICIMRNASPEAVLNLGHGFYIINGKKIFIR